MCAFSYLNTSAGMVSIAFSAARGTDASGHVHALHKPAGPPDVAPLGRFVVCGTPGDGDCLLHALCMAMREISRDIDRGHTAVCPLSE